MKTTNQIKHLRPRSTDGFFPYKNTKWYSEEEINKKANDFNFMYGFRGFSLSEFLEYLFGDEE